MAHQEIGAIMPAFERGDEFGPEPTAEKPFDVTGIIVDAPSTDFGAGEGAILYDLDLPLLDEQAAKLAERTRAANRRVNLEDRPDRGRFAARTLNLSDQYEGRINFKGRHIKCKLPPGEVELDFETGDGSVEPDVEAIAA